jgi:hypothetical protein
VGDLEAAGPAQIIALYEQAAKLDPNDGLGTAYGRYIQALPGDEARAAVLLAQVAAREPGNALIPMERARQAAASGDYGQMARELSAAATTGRFHRPLFTSLPREIRGPFLGAHLVWERLNEAGFGFDYIDRDMRLLVGPEAAYADRARFNLLKTRIGALLMQSDLPHDWVLGAKLRRDALGALSREPELPPELAARVRVELSQVQATITARPQPLLMTTLWQSRLFYTPVTDEDAQIVGPLIVAFRTGGVMVGSGSPQ